MMSRYLPPAQVMCTEIYTRLTVNQLLFAATLFCNLPKKNWFTAINLSEENITKDIGGLVRGEKYSRRERNIHDIEAVVNLAKIFRMRIKVGFQY